MTRQTITGRVEAWLATNPGFYTPSEVAAGVGIDKHSAAKALLTLSDQGRCQRYRNQARPNGPGASRYSAA